MNLLWASSPNSYMIISINLDPQYISSSYLSPWTISIFRWKVIGRNTLPEETFIFPPIFFITTQISQLSLPTIYAKYLVLKKKLIRDKRVKQWFIKTFYHDIFHDWLFIQKCLPSSTLKYAGILIQYDTN